MFVNGLIKFDVWNPVRSLGENRNAELRIEFKMVKTELSHLSPVGDTWKRRFLIKCRSWIDHRVMRWEHRKLIVELSDRNRRELIKALNGTC